MESQKKSKNQFTRTAKPKRCKKSILSLKKQTAFLVVTILSVIVLFNSSFAQAATDIVGWNTSSIVNSIRRNAL